MDPKKTKKTALTNVNDKEVLADAKPIVGEQAEQANTNVNANDKASAGEFDYNPKRIDGHGSSVKQEAIAKAISGSGTGSSGSGFTPFGANQKGIPYSGTDARIIDNASGTPAFNKSDRSDSRYGQKTDNTARHINYVPSETYLVETDGPVPLSESADRVQGTLGHPANEFARIQKCSEAFPGALNFERSIDEITDDCAIYCQGQQIKYVNDDNTYSDIDPTVRFDAETSAKTNYKISRANYLPRTLHVKYDNGTLYDYYYDEDVSHPTAKGDLVAERAATHTITAANRAEIDRQAMAAKAGNEVESTWSPIPFGYPEPTRDVLYLTTVEKQLGANVFVPVKMAAKAHSYALNKASKDGMRPESGGIEIGLGPVVSYSESKGYDAFNFNSSSSDEASIFHTKYTSKGAPSAIVAMLDSVAKYHDRGDLLTQPRSFNMTLKQGLSNYKTFKIDPEFARVFDNINVFSTIDRAYDPSSPVCITDTIGVVNPYSFNELGSCFRTASISKLIETNLNNDADDATDAFYNNKVFKIVDNESAVAGVNHSYIVLPTQFISLKSNEHIEDVTFTADIYEQAAKLVRSHATTAAPYGQLFKCNYIVPYMRAASATVNKENHVVFLAFNFSENKMNNDDTRSMTIHYTYNGTDQTENITTNSGTINASSASIYNEYLAVYYRNRQNYYYLELRDPYTDGIKTFLRRNYGLLRKVVDPTTGSLAWPVHYSTKSFSAYAYLVMLSLKFIQEQRSKAMLDVLNYSNNFGYPFSDCDDTGSYSALGGSQYGQSDIFELLEVRQMTPAIALRWTMPELFGALSASSGYRTLMPIYMNEDNFEFHDVNSDSEYELELSHERASMSYPVTKYGVRWAYSDDLYGISERDYRLIADMLVIPPSFNGSDSHAYSAEPEVYKYSQANDGLLVIPSDVSIQNVFDTPRELGYISSVAGGYLFPEPSYGTGNEVNPKSESFVFSTRCDADASIVGHSAFRVVCWVIEDGTPATSILADGSSVITRASNFTQKYYIFNVHESNPGSVIGLCLSTSATSGSTSGITSFVPFTNGIFRNGKQTILSDRPALFTYAKGLWSRLQKLPFSINPFDFGGTITADPFSFNYLFGLLGFRASDYKEDLYNRLTERMAEGWKFIEDPFVRDSLLVK